MSENIIDKTTVYKPGDKVIARGSFGVPASPRLFKPLKDAAKEYGDYSKLVTSRDKNIHEFISKMVFPTPLTGTTSGSTPRL